MTTRARTCLVSVLLALALGGCSQEEAFTDYRTYQPCDGNYPACLGRSAGCFLDADGYLEGTFPGGRRFLVVTEGQAEVTVHIFFRTQTHPGTAIAITYFEPACKDRVAYEEEFDDLFSVAGEDRIFSHTDSVFERGEHLVEVYSDAYSDYLIKVELN